MSSFRKRLSRFYYDGEEYVLNARSSSVPGFPKLLRILDSEVVTGSIMALLMVDLLLTFIEITVDLIVTHSKNSHRIHNSASYRAFEISCWAISITIISIFAIEIFLRMIGLGFRRWSRKVMNWVDFFVVYVSLILLAIFNRARSDASQRLAGFLILFRIWRIFRVLGTSAAATTRHTESEIHRLKQENEKLRRELQRYKIMAV
jgi:hypothetical protein